MWNADYVMQEYLEGSGAYLELTDISLPFVCLVVCMMTNGQSRDSGRFANVHNHEPTNTWDGYLS